MLMARGPLMLRWILQPNCNDIDPGKDAPRVLF